jgi:riboflavin kinase/FMN adenylyltransferase
VEVWRAVEQARARPTVVSIGTFDGVHRGHRVVVQSARDEARRRDLPLTILTFDPHPMSVVRPGSEPPAIATVRHRVELLGQYGADAVLVLPFTATVAAMSAAEFITSVLLDTLDSRVVVVGDDFRFGNRAAGDVTLLRACGRKHGFDLVAVAPVGHDGVRWSSTEVRARVADGDVAAAAEVLGHLFEVEGPVVRGDQRGRQLGYPTANVAVDPGMLVPADGVYAGYLRRIAEPARVLPAAVSVGTNPTFDGVGRRVEAYVLGPDALDLYDQPVAVSFVHRLRGQARFDDVDALVRQMRDDVARTRDLLSTRPRHAVSSLIGVEPDA